jgi:hypothetical protein
MLFHDVASVFEAEHGGFGRGHRKVQGFKVAKFRVSGPISFPGAQTVMIERRSFTET